jgi:hypothetical protein
MYVAYLYSPVQQVTGLTSWRARRCSTALTSLGTAASYLRKRGTDMKLWLIILPLVVLLAQLVRLTFKDANDHDIPWMLLDVMCIICITLTIIYVIRLTPE